MKYSIILLLIAIKLSAMDTPNSISIQDFEFRNIEDELKQACQKSHKEILSNRNKDFAEAYLFKLIEGLVCGFGRAFNWSIAEFKEGYVAAVRVACAKDEKKKIVPGNGPECPYEQGSNFWWAEGWDSSKFYSGTIFFFCNKTLQNFSLILPWNPIPNMEDAQDMRLMNEGTRLFAYIPNKLELAFEISDIISPFKDGFFIIGNTIPNYRLKKHNQIHDKNWAMLECNENYCLFLDWFYLDGVKLIKTDNRSGISNYGFLKYNADEKDLKYTIYGFGSCQQNDDKHLAGHNYMIMPWFSFGTPHVKINDCYLGIGHIKIWISSADKYKKNSNIALFREKLNNYFHEKFNDKHIRHYHFIYMMYFYRIKLNQSGIEEMTISDAYLPENTSMEYSFSLIFPMGIALSPDKNKLLVSAGAGDYYPVLMKFDVEEVEALAKKHNMQQVDMHKFEYKLIKK